MERLFCKPGIFAGSIYSKMFDQQVSDYVIKEKKIKVIHY